MESPPTLAEEIQNELCIDLRHLRDWWGADSVMASRTLCTLGLSRMIQLILDNEREKVLSSPDLWLMQDASAATDISPYPVDFDRLLEWLRAQSITSGLAPVDHPLYQFYQKFLPALSEWGRLEAADVGLAPPVEPSGKGGGFFGKLFSRAEPEEERLPLREIQDIPGFFAFWKEVDGWRNPTENEESPEKGNSE
ncbi:hypothetical protein H8D30_04355 [bacterium]|nr:hypothetical protein [bacterium]